MSLTDLARAGIVEHRRVRDGVIVRVTPRFLARLQRAARPGTDPRAAIDAALLHWPARTHAGCAADLARFLADHDQAVVPA